MLIELSRSELQAIDTALEDGLQNCEVLFNFKYNNKNRKKYPASYEFYKRYQKLQPKIKKFIKLKEDF